MWSGLIAIPPAIGWYVSTYETVQSLLPLALANWVQHVLLGLCVSFGVIALITNAFAHRKFDKLLTSGESPYPREWRPMMATELLAFMKPLIRLKPHAKELEQIKIISTKKGRVVADVLAQALAVLEYDVARNADDGSTISSAPPDQLNGIILRFQQTRALGPGLLAGLMQAGLGVHQEHFPLEERYRRVQIEIGDWVEGAQWD
jgi:hypothetical protein